MNINNPLYIEDLNTVVSETLPWDKLNDCSILITGANGLIGSFLVDCLMYRNKLNNSNIAVYSLCRNEKKAKERFSCYLNDKNFHLIIQDVCEALSCDIQLDYIIHAASNAHPLSFAKTPIETMKANILGSISLLEYAQRCKLRKFIFISSSEVYGKNNSGETGLKEDYCGYIDCANFRSSYPESKRASETLCVGYSKQYGININIVRPGYIYGPTTNDESSKADAQFIRNAADGKDIIMKSLGMQLRSYCYISDFTSALLYVMLLGENNSVYNIANKNSTASIRDVAESLASISRVNVVFENPDHIEKSGYSLSENVVLNADKLEGLGWKGKISLDNGLKRTVEIVKS